MRIRRHNANRKWSSFHLQLPERCIELEWPGLYFDYIATWLIFTTGKRTAATVNFAEIGPRCPRNYRRRCPYSLCFGRENRMISHTTICTCDFYDILSLVVEISGRKVDIPHEGISNSFYPRKKCHFTFIQGKNRPVTSLLRFLQVQVFIAEACLHLVYFQAVQ